MLVELRDVSRRFEHPGVSVAPPVLDQIDLSLEAGRSLGIIGPSGSGKSTLLNLIGALDRPTEGEVFIDGIDLEQHSERERTQLRARRIGFIFQAHHLLPQCTVQENVLLPTLAEGVDADPQQSAERARQLLGRVGLTHRLDHTPAQLSGGECQRVAVVRSLINQPQLLLADEPTGALDQDNAEALMDLLVELNRDQQVALIVVTHARHLTRSLDRVLMLQRGRLHEVTDQA
jgi:ABC-type lipoprotein export system ATPase subunit